MRKLAADALSLLFALVSSHAQSDESSFVTSYDKFDDITHITLKQSLSIAGTATDGLRLTVVAAYRGQTRKTPEVIVFAIGSVAPAARYDSNTKLILLVDAERLDLGQMKRNKLEYHQSGYAIEALGIDIPLGTLARIAKAQSVEGRIGEKTFALTGEQLKVLRAFVGHLSNGNAIQGR